ncbi:MAG: hypothetical protein WBU92_02415 [Candidatus Dormiibacterota bacterium]
MNQHPQPEPTAVADHLPEDIKLGEAGRNWVDRHRAAEPDREVRKLAADASVTAAIASAYSTDW